MTSYDCIVIGAGGIGSAALDHVASRGASVLGIERFGIAHDQGSSHGHTRVIRQAYFEHPDYVPLLVDAYRLWDDLAEHSGQPLISRCGLLLAGVPDGPAVAGTRHAARLHGLDLPIHIYPAGHGFCCDERPDYHEESCRLADQRSLELFQQHVKT